ncbi:hypothetical protein B0T09DRAFT_250713, partial [Sordaria sp. MPI-SDFR-AT-0083]
YLSEEPSLGLGPIWHVIQGQGCASIYGCQICLGHNMNRAMLVVTDLARHCSSLCCAVSPCSAFHFSFRTPRDFSSWMILMPRLWPMSCPWCK